MTKQEYDEMLVNEIQKIIKNKVVPAVDNILNDVGYIREYEVISILNKEIYEPLGIHPVPCNRSFHLRGFTKNPFKED